MINLTDRDLETLRGGINGDFWAVCKKIYTAHIAAVREQYDTADSTALHVIQARVRALNELMMLPEAIVKEP